METVFLKLFNMSMAAGWLIIAVIVLRLVFKKAPKWLSCILWAMVAVRLVCPFSLESSFSLVPSAETISPAAVQYGGNPWASQYTGLPEFESGVPYSNHTGLPVKMNAQKGAWFRVGINGSNPTNEDINVYVRVKGVTVRIAELDVRGGTDSGADGDRVGRITSAGMEETGVVSGGEGEGAGIISGAGEEGEMLRGNETGLEGKLPPDRIGMTPCWRMPPIW